MAQARNSFLMEIFKAREREEQSREAEEPAEKEMILIVCIPCVRLFLFSS